MASRDILCDWGYGRLLGLIFVEVGTSVPVA